MIFTLIFCFVVFTVANAEYGATCSGINPCSGNLQCNDGYCVCQRGLHYNSSVNTCQEQCASYGDTYQYYYPVGLTPPPNPTLYPFEFIPNIQNRSQCTLFCSDRQQSCKQYIFWRIICVLFNTTIPSNAWLNNSDNNILNPGVRMCGTPNGACVPGQFRSISTSDNNVTATVLCTSCPAGTISTVTNADSCTQCPAGQIPNTDSSACTHCSAGQIPSADQSGCLMCEGDTISAAGDAECTNCDPGKVANNNNTQCVCPAGQIQTQSGCINCVGNTISAAGDTVCRECASNELAINNHSQCVELENLNFTSVKQSGRSKKRKPSFAIDGKNKTCAITGKKTDPYWNGTLESQSIVTEVQILFGRGGKTHNMNVTVYVGNEACGNYVGKGSRIVNVICQQAIRGSYISVVRHTSIDTKQKRRLRLCELQVKGHSVPSE